MFLAYAICLSNIEPVTAVAENCATAHETLNNARVLVDVGTIGIYSSERTSYDLTYDRSGSADLKVIRSRPFRIVVAGNTVTEYDSKSKQYSEKVRGTEDFDVAVRKGAGNLDELVASLMTPQGVRTWLGSLKLGRIWNYRVEPQGLVLSSGKAKDNTTIVIDSQSGLLRHILVKTGRYGTEWTFRYATPSTIAFTPPKDAYKVKELTPEIVPPVYASSQAKLICERIFAKYDRPRNLAYSVQSDTESFDVWIDHGRARQRDMFADWIIEPKGFRIAVFGTKLYSSGPLDMTKAVDAIHASGTRVEPILKLALRGINPFRLYMGQNAKVAWKGRTKVNGEACSILQSDSTGSSLSIIARDSDGFVMSMVSVPKDSTTTVSRRFKPLKVQPASFKLEKPSGWNTKALDDLAGHPGPT